MDNCKNVTVQMRRVVLSQNGRLNGCRIIVLFFPQLNVVGLLFVLAVTVLVVIVGFPLFGPRRENGRYIFRIFYLQTPQYLKS